MRASRMSGTTLFLTAAFLFSVFTSVAAIHTKDRKAALQRIRVAKFVFFDDQSQANLMIGRKTVAELKKWGKFEIVQERTKADLIILLSADPYQGDHFVVSTGRTGTVAAREKVDEDRVSDVTRGLPPRDAYLTVIDAKSGAELWTASHHWGGLLTGRDSVGVHLVRKLRKEVK